MSPEAFINHLLNGASLSSVMIPDPAIPTNDPAHDETYKLHFIYLEENKFFAQTNTMHRAIRMGSIKAAPHSFCYSYGYENTMLISAPEQKQTIIGDMNARYSKFEWVIRNDYDLIWHSDNKSEVSALREAILAGKETKLAIKDDEGIWNILPVDLVNIEQASGEFIIRTETGYPAIIVPNKPQLNATIASAHEHLEGGVDMLHTKYPTIPIYYACYSDGSYYNYFDETKTLRRKYQELRVFAKSDSGSTPIHIDYISR